jgi:hypothetical protein
MRGHLGISAPTAELQAVPNLDRIAVAIPELSGKVAGAIDTDLSAHGMRDMTKGFVTRRRGTIP